MLKRGSVLILLIFSLFLPLFLNQVRADEPVQNNSSILITGLRTGGTDTKDQEFVELYNNGEGELNIGQWKLKYTAASTSGTGSTKYTFPIDTVLEAGEYTLVATQSYLTANPTVEVATMNNFLSDDGGHLILVDNIGGEIDRIGWGNAQYPKISAAPSPSISGQSLKQCSENDLFMNSGDNGYDFSLVTLPMHFLLGPPCAGGQPDEVSNGLVDKISITCEGIIITEILPNPAGSDNGNEFIELYNPTVTDISLQGCSLQTTANSKVYNFGEVDLQPETYLAIYDSQSGLTLPNGAGGTAWLLSPTDELQAISYPSSMEDDTAWALFSVVWQRTYQPTPHAVNVLVATKPCPSGQVRNPETNRCRNILTLSVSTLGPCRDGYERNPETNRCRKIDNTVSQLVPCKAGQYRNPETNRCRKVESDSLKPCSAGQYRNPATNRCKKLSDGEVRGIATVKDVESAESNTPFQWGIAGVVALGAIGYGLYEWRQDIFNAIGRLRKRA